MIISSALFFLFQAPSKLLIQVPRFGKQYKTYEKIIPAAKLNVADLIVLSCKLFYLPHFELTGIIMVFFLLFKINALSVRRVPGSNAQHVPTSTDLRSVQQVALLTSVIAVHM